MTQQIGLGKLWTNSVTYQLIRIKFSVLRIINYDQERIYSTHQVFFGILLHKLIVNLSKGRFEVELVQQSSCKPKFSLTVFGSGSRSSLNPRYF